ncbi:Serine/threonine-protein kinase ATG1c [Balamuthia mandrillaris]
MQSEQVEPELEEIMMSWVEVRNDPPPTPRPTQEVFLQDLLKEMVEANVIWEGDKETKIGYALVNLVVNKLVHPLACKCLAHFLKVVRNSCLISEMADQLYDHFYTAEEPSLALTALKIMITELPAIDPVRLDRGSREFQLALNLVESLALRITGGLSKKNLADSVGLLEMLLRNFGFIMNNHPKLRNIQFWGDWFCTGVELGKGSYANVFLGHSCKDAQVVAIKVMDWDRLTRGRPKLCEQLENEIDIMRASEHPNIVRLYDVVREGCNLNLIIEYCGGGSMDEYLKKRGPLREVEAKHWLMELALGLKFLREKGILHRDLKPGNLLLSVDSPAAHLKITDFTFARFIEPGDLATTLVGTPLYMAPEIFLDKKYTEKADLWSVGVILYQMLTGRVPYLGSNVMELVRNIQTKGLEFPSALDISPDMKDLLKNLLQKKPALRMSWVEFFSHPCVNQGSTLEANGTNLSASMRLDMKDKEIKQLKMELTKAKDALAITDREKKLLEGDYDKMQEKLDAKNQQTELLKQQLCKLQQAEKEWLKMVEREQKLADCKSQEVAKLQEENAVLREQIQQLMEWKQQSIKEAEASKEKEQQEHKIDEERQEEIRRLKAEVEELSTQVKVYELTFEAEAKERGFRLFGRHNSSKGGRAK